MTDRKKKVAGSAAREEIIGELMRRRGGTLACAESCTGGLLSDRITDVPGSSDYFGGSIISYSNELKKALLGVGGELLERYGAVSEECARAMAMGVRVATRASIGLSTTGIAGPTGATSRKPVGLVFTALAADEGVWVWRQVLPGDRREVKEQAAEAGLEMLCQFLAAGTVGARD